VISTQKQPGCKKGAALFKMANMKKLQNQKGRPKIHYDGINLQQKF